VMCVVGLDSRGRLVVFRRKKKGEEECELERLESSRVGSGLAV
jgi:hypothetical protein